MARTEAQIRRARIAAADAADDWWVPKGKARGLLCSERPKPPKDKEVRP